MNSLLLPKVFLGIGVLTAIGTAGTFLGAETSMEQQILNSNQNLKKISEKSIWEQKVKQLQNSNNTPPESSIFKNIFDNDKSGNRVQWTFLSYVCGQHLNDTYKGFGISSVQKNENNLLLKDLETYCFTTK